MSKYREFFLDDLAVNNDPYLKSIVKMIGLSILFIIAFILSNLTVYNSLYAILSLFVLVMAILFTLNSSFNLLNFKSFNIREITYLVLGLLLIFVINQLFTYFFPTPNANTKEIEKTFSGVPFWASVISIAIIPSFVEEIISRGFILRVIFRNHLFIGMIVSTLVFVVLHDGQNFVGFLPYIYSGFILSLIYLKTKRLEVVILIHFLNNIVATFSILH
ncbi:CPBP family intramembrane metalloprotease [Staphylococcus agnetis]|uniref:CPBP family intramembrane glutamic endopeptidase n=3 Tax=Staphylococcus agnetis TaxID=985762 RepID=UPI00208F15ED|nr:CPBP family intramembrane metalloprotease [Staphylococcus agnetis]MCO4344246.1 CPBP family intramembrane metalloprotease [Staphylococcus agnetis]MCO4368124.1 CPBP family intramembrane metalloprotease [Staphylococcus agnetis]